GQKPSWARTRSGRFNTGTPCAGEPSESSEPRATYNARSRTSVSVSMCQHIVGGVAEVIDQRFFHLRPGVAIGRSQHGRRVIRGHDVSALGGDHLSALTSHSEITAEQGLSGGSSKANDHARPRQFELGLKPWAASSNFASARFGMEAALA